MKRTLALLARIEHLAVVLCLAGLAMACGGSTSSDSGADGGTDSGMGSDGGSDAGSDAGGDATCSEASSLCPPPTETHSGPAELPRVYLDTHYVAPTGVTHTVAEGESLQAAIDAATCGDEIVLSAGATFTGNFILRNKACDGRIVIRSSELGELPEGMRVMPSDAVHMAKLVSATSATSVVRTEPGAHGYRLAGLEITVAPTVALTYTIVAIGTAGADQDTLEEVPSDFVIDRSYVHGHATLDSQRCVAVNSASTAVIESYLDECHYMGADSQAVIGWNGPGPFKIVNNHLSAGAEIVMFGGADPSIDQLIPSDIEIRFNHFHRPMAWQGAGWTIKNLFETKNCMRVLVENNVFENHWAQAQDGFAIVLKSANQGGSAPWSTAQDLVFRYNLLENISGGFNIIKADTYSGPTTPTQRVHIAHNVTTSDGVNGLDGHGRIFQINGDVADLLVEHNTMIADPDDSAVGAGVLFVGNDPVERLIIRDNIVIGKGQYNYTIGSAEGKGVGLAALNWHAPGWTVAGNVFVRTDASGYPEENGYVATLDDVGFAAWTTGDVHLAPSSTFAGTATDGTDPGAAVDELQTRLVGVVSAELTP
jgi:hypothetical protein